MANRYWVGGTGSWTTLSTTKWSTATGITLTGASCSGTTLTTTTSPTLVVGMTVFAAAGTSLGTISGGSGNTWTVTTGGTYASQTMTAGTTGASVPSATDDVFFDANSGTGTITLTGALNCLSFDATGSGVLTFSSTGTINCRGSFTIVANTTWSAGGTITFSSTTTGRTITTNGVTLSTALVFNGVGGGWTLGSSLTTVFGITITNGTFDTSSSGNYSLTVPSITTSSGTKTINLNASTVTLNGVSPLALNGTGLTLNAGTSQINLSSTSGITCTAAAVNTFYNVSVTQVTNTTVTLQLPSGTTFNNLLFVTPNSTNNTNVVLYGNITVNGTLTLPGNSIGTRIFLRSDTVGTARTVTANSVSLSNCDFRNITAAGTASPFTGTNLGDCLGNTNITFTGTKTVYWNLGGTASLVTDNGWATSSGGTPSSANFPLPQDTAILDDAGAVGTVSFSGLSSPINICTFNMSARNSAMTLATANVAVSLYGDWLNGTGVSITGTGVLTFLGSGLTKTITSNGVAFTQPITINAPSGTVQLADAITAGVFTLTNGTFNASNYNATLNSAALGVGTKTLTMGSGTWTISGTGTVWDLSTNTTGLTFSGASAPILLSNTTTTARTFDAGVGLTYNKLTIGGATGVSTTTILGASTAATFSELAATKTVAHTITFNTNGAPTIGTWSVTGTSGNVVTVNSSTVGTQRQLAVTNKTSGIDYLNITNITQQNISPVTFWAGSNSTNGGNNKGIAFASGATTQAYILTSGSLFTTPADWNNAANSIYLIGGGGGGSGGINGAANTRSGGAGGGGGGFRLLTNQTLGVSTTYTIGVGGAAGAASPTSSTGGNGQSTVWDTTNIATGGTGGAATTTTSTGGTGGTGTYTGGTGGTGAQYVGALIVTGGGGGGSAGPNGNGGTGGNGNGGVANNDASAGGGGGNGGGTAGGNGVPGASGSGGNNSLGTGGGASASQADGNSGTLGGGGSGGESNGARGGLGGTGVDILGGFGSGGGSGGGAGLANTAATAGLYGGGGGGGSSTGTAFAGAAGATGAIIIVYTPIVSPTVTNGNFFFLF